MVYGGGGLALNNNCSYCYLQNTVSLTCFDARQSGYQICDCTSVKPLNFVKLDDLFETVVGSEACLSASIIMSCRTGEELIAEIGPVTQESMFKTPTDLCTILSQQKKKLFLFFCYEIKRQIIHLSCLMIIKRVTQMKCDVKTLHKIVY